MCKQPQFVLLVPRKIHKTTSFDFVAPNSNFTDSAESLLDKNQHTIIPRKRSNVMIINCHGWATRGLWKGDFDICGDLRRFTASNCRVDGTAPLWPHLATVCGRKVLTVLPFYGPIRTGMHSVVNNVLGEAKEIKSADTIRWKWRLWAPLSRRLFEIFQIWKIDLIHHFFLFTTVSRTLEFF